MNFSQLKALFYDKYRESSTNSAFSEAKVKNWINEGYRNFLNYNLWDFLVTENQTANVFTHCAGDCTGTTLAVDSVLGIQKGMILYVSDKIDYERVEITSINAKDNLLSLKPPGLLGTYTVGDTVSSPHLFLPSNCRKLVEIKLLNISSTSQDATVLKYCDSRDLDVLFPYNKTLEKPEYYIRGGISVTQEGAGASYTAESGTGSGAIVCSSLTGHFDDYYKGWRIVNWTRNCDSMVTAYNSQQKTLTISPIITGQVSGDHFLMQRDMEQIFLHPIPDKRYTVSFRFYRNCDDLRQDYDVPVMGAMGENLCDMLVDYALAEAYLCDKNPEMASHYRQKYLSSLEQLRLQERQEPDHLINFRLVDKRLPGFYR